MRTEGSVRVQVVHAWPDRYWSKQLDLPATASVGDALALVQEDLSGASIDTGQLSLAVYGRTVESRTRLRDGDRIELLRPLLISPQEARSGRAAAARRVKRK